jgi:hypothetical protein
MKSLHLVCLRRRKMMMEKVNLQQHFSQHWKALTVRKYLMKFDVNDNTMAALSSIENEVYRVQQKAKKQQLNLMDMWKKRCR